MAEPVGKKLAKKKSVQLAKGRAQKKSAPAALSGSHADILALQRNIGNRGVSELLQSKTEGAQDAINNVPPIVKSVLHDNSGQPLDSATRESMESTFSQDLSQVRVHTDEQAAESARALNARAYTMGQDVVFGARQYAPETTAGKRLLAHELIHMIQQKRSGIDSKEAKRISQPGNPAEMKAGRGAERIMAGEGLKIDQPICPYTIYRDVIAETLELEGGLWIVGPYAEITMDLLGELTGLSLFRDREGKVYILARPRVLAGTSRTAATLIQEIINNREIKVVINAVDFISSGLIGAFDEPAGSGQQQVDILDIEAAHELPGIHSGAALFHEISEAYFGRLVEREPGLRPPGERLYDVAHPMALEAENRVRRELGLPAREHDEFPLIQLPPSITGSSRAYAVSIHVFATHFQIDLLTQDPATGNIVIEQTFVTERDIADIDWDRDWLDIVNRVAPRFRLRP